MVRNILGGDGTNSSSFAVMLHESSRSGIPVINEHVENCVISHVDASNAELVGCRLENVRFYSCVANDLVMRNCDLLNVSLAESALPGLEVHSSHLEGVKVVKSMLNGMLLEQSSLNSVHLDGVELSGSALRFDVLYSLSLLNCDLGSMLAERCNLYGLRFEGPTQSNTVNALLKRCKVEGASLSQVSLSSMKLLDGVVRNACLFNSSLQNLDLSGTDLINVKLVNTCLNNVLASGVDLSQQGQQSRNVEPLSMI